MISLIVYLTLSNLINSSAADIVAATEFLNAIVILAFNPYKHYIHWIGLIINQTGIILNAAWIASQQYTILTKSVEDIIAFILLGWIILIVVWSFIRSIF